MPGSVPVGFVMETVALGQVFLRFLQSSLVSIIPLLLSILIYHLGDKQQVHWWPQFRDIVSTHQHE
jgi:hypothetical protein